MVVPAEVKADAAPAKADSSSPSWRLVLQDNFERREVGPDWAGLVGDLSIVDGHLRLEAPNNAIAVCTRSFPGDVRLECDGWTEPDRVACDLTIFLARNREQGPGSGYFLGFGSYHDTRNRLRVAGRVLARNDGAYRIGKPGTRHKLVAQKRGGHVWLEVDGKRILEGRDEDPWRGYLEDLVGLYCWNSAIGIDNVRIYDGGNHPERPAAELLRLPVAMGVSGGRWILTLQRSVTPDPAIHEGVNAYNEGDLTTAFSKFRGAQAGIAKVAGLAWVVGHLDFAKEREGFEALKAALDELPPDLADAPRLRLLRTLTVRLEQGVDPKGPDRSHNLHQILGTIGPDHPFYNKAMLNRGRVVHWEWRESGQGFLKAARDAIFVDLKQRCPDNRLVRVYSGESVPWGEAFMNDAPEAPAWARYLRESYRRCLEVVAWWGENRQAADGQLGGGWGDDVEILRDWGPLALISNARPAVRQTVRRLVDGVWRSPAIAESGFAVGLADIEHSAEPSGDSQPIMLAIDYGNPIYAERNLLSAKVIRDRLMGRTPRGHFHWKSNQVCSRGPSDNPLFAADVPYAARAFKHVVWLAWYSRNPHVEKMVVDWARAWLEDTMREEDGKPRGVIPAGVGFPDETLGRRGAKWWDPDLGWTYYRWDAGTPGNLYDLFAFAWVLSRDDAFLEPLKIAFEYGKKPPPPAGVDRSRGSEAYILDTMRGTMFPRAVRAAAMARFLTGDKRFDDILREHGNAYQKFLLTGDRTGIEAMAKRAAEGMRRNFEMMTSEVLMTDRAGVGSGVPAALYCGLVREWGDSGVPCFAVNWETPTENFAAFVTRAERDSFEALLYNFENKPIVLVAHFFQLRRGRYSCVTGPAKADDPSTYSGQAGTVFVRHRGDGRWIYVPPRVPWVVRVQLATPLPEGVLPDAALSDATVVNEDGKLRISATVHNIGGADLWPCRVVLLANGGKREIARTQVPLLPLNESLEPARRRISLVVPDAPTTGELTLRVVETAIEITGRNNELRLRIPPAETD